MLASWTVTGGRRTQPQGPLRATTWTAPAAPGPRSMGPLAGLLPPARRAASACAEQGRSLARGKHFQQRAACSVALWQTTFHYQINTYKNTGPRR